MKNTIRLIGIITIVVIIGFSMASCGSEGDSSSPGHKHTWGVWTVTTPPTATINGEETRICSSCTESETKPRPPYNLGDTGPGGGKIFYKADTGFIFFQNATDAVGLTAYYLEAAPADMATTLLWASDIQPIPNLSLSYTDDTDWAIGRGKKNTEIIIAHGINHGIPYTTPAASACVGYDGGSKTDWFLPSKDELSELYKNKGLLEIPNNNYFSSSQESTTSAWGREFSSTWQGTFSKNGLRDVRAIRAF